ncbi:hypothetical protein IQ250_07145 [Pseudanabaenaceae cyanobacterium LEGE 13415]|nr:hypothetical protein [Pseudanabaenaceae cyanobacterium LEGE 13415]
MKKQLLALAVLSTIAFPLSHARCFANTARVAAEETYKIQLREISQPADNDSFARSLGFKRDRGRAEWAVVTLTDRKTVKIRHATRIGEIFSYRWFDHPVTAIRMCNGESFDTNDTKKDCTIIHQRGYRNPSSRQNATGCLL